MKWIQSRKDLVKNSVAIFAVLLVSVLGVKLLTASHAATGGSLSLTSSATSLTPGSTVAVTVHEDSGTDPVNSVQASLNYDSTQLQYVSLTEGTAFPTVAANSTSTPGVIRVGRATQSTPVTGSNTVVTVNFKVLASSGSVGLSFDKNFSFLVRSTDNTDILAVTTGLTIPVAGSSAGGASMSLTPGSTSVAAGSTVTVTVHENSGTTNVNSVQASVGYNAAQLQYVSMTEGNTFTNQAATDTATAGRVRVARSVQTGSVGVTGDNPIVTLSFKVLASSGTTALTIDKTQSFVVASSSNADILGTVAGTTLTVTVPPPTGGGSATLSLSPSSGSFAPNSTVSIVVSASSSSALTTVESVLNYPASQLQYLSTTEGGVFTTAQRTNTATSGVVDIIRSLPGGSAGVTGSNTVVTVNFKVIGTTGSAAVTFGTASAVYDDSGTGTNILNRTASTTANYTIASSPTPPPPPPPPPPATGSPDLVVTNVSWAPASPATGNQVTFSATIKNQGTASTPSGVIHGISFTVDGQQVNWSDNNTTSLAPGASRTQTANGGPTGSAVWSATAGTHTIMANVDDAHRIVESNESNNTLTSQMTVNSTPPPSKATLSLTPASGTFAQNSTVSVLVKASSSSALLTTIQASLNYPASQLQYISTTEGSVYTTAQRTNTGTSGLVDLIRSIPGGNAGVVGTNPVVIVNFKVIGTSGSAAVTFASTSAIYDDSGTGTNIIDLAASTTASYTVSGGSVSCTTSPTTPGTPTRTASTYTTATISWSASTAGSNCALAGYHVYRDGSLAGDVTSGTSFTDIGLTAGESHIYTVKAFDTAGHTSSTSSGATISSKADDQSPTTPVGFTAAAPDAVSVNLAWNPSTDFPNPGGVGVAGYHIYRNGATTPTYNVTSGTAFTDTNVTANTTYSYIVNAYDKVGNESSPSNIVSAKTATGSVSCTGNPSTPTGLASGPTTQSTIDLSWAASTPSSGCTLAGYHVFRNSTLVGSPASQNYQDSGLSASTSYTYTVQSYDTNGHTSPISTGKVIATSADTTAPSAPTGVTAAAISSGQVSIAWIGSSDNVGVTGYRIYRGGTLIHTSLAATRSYSDTTVSANTNYAYTVSAVDAANNESARTAATPNPVHTPAAADTQAPTAPTGLKTLTVSTASVVIGWNPSSDNVGVAGYHVYRDGTYLNDAIGLSFSDTSLTSGTTYSYTVKAFDASGNTSAASSALSVTTLAPIGCIVADLNCDRIVDEIDLSILLSHLQEVNVPARFGDINIDGLVDEIDLSILLSHLGDTA